jgi:hypothetical protein
MSIVDKVLEFITDELNIEITEKNKELIIDKFILISYIYLFLIFISLI